MMSRRLVVLGVREYPYDDPNYPAGFDAQLDELRAWWCHDALGAEAFTVVTPAIATKGDLSAVVDREGLADAGPDDILVVYITGHGIRRSSGRHFLRMPDGDDARPSRTHVNTAELVELLLASDAEHLLVLVNSCFGGAIDAHITQVVRDIALDRRNLHTIGVVTVGDFDERPRLLELKQMLATARQRFIDVAGITTPQLTVDQFVAELSRAAQDQPNGELLRPTKVYPKFTTLTETFALPNPGYRVPTDVVEPQLRDVAADAAELDYWLDRASGRMSSDDPGWYFSGRRELAAQLAEFLSGTTGSLIVTGVAGSGKSALLARAVTLSDRKFLADPRFADTIAAIAQTAPDTLPRPGSVHAAVLARNQTPADVLRAIAIAVNANLGAIGTERDENEALRRAIAASAALRPMTVVVDGLDEATHPARLVWEVLGPLAQLTNKEGLPLIRFAVGLRSPGPDMGPGTLLGSVAAVLPGVTVMRTDDEPEPDIANYVAAVLRHPDSPYRGLPDAMQEAARATAEIVTPSFLDARFAAHALRARAKVQDLTDPSWRATLAEGTMGLLAEDLRLLDEGGARHALAVLQASAFAVGRGVPWGEVWPAMAEAVLDDEIPNADAVIGRVLKGRLAGYLTEDVEDERRVYRPVHEQLARNLRDITAMTERRSDDMDIHARIAVRLSSLVEDNGGPPHPYLRRHLIEHAASGNALNDATLPGSFLKWETSGTIRAHLGVPPPRSDDNGGLVAWAAIEPHLSDASPLSRAVSHEFAKVALGEEGTAGFPLRTRWARWRLIPNTLAKLDTGIVSIAPLTDLEGRVLLAMGCGDGAVRIWDPSTGDQVGDELTGHTYGVRAVAAVTTGGRVLLATGSGDGTVRVWDPATGALVRGWWTAHTGGVWAVASFTTGGRVLLASGGNDGTVRVWDPVTGGLVRGWWTAHTGGVWVVTAFTTEQSRVLVATASSFDGTVRIWDPATGAQVGDDLIGHTYGVSAVASFTNVQGGVLLAVGGNDGTVRIWDPVASAQADDLIGHTEGVWAVASFTTGSRVLLATGSFDGTVRIWDPVAGARVGDELTGHTYGVRAVTWFSTRDDGWTVREWDPATGAQMGEEPIGHTYGVEAVTSFTNEQGRALLATGRFDGTVRVWDPATGAQVGNEWTSHTNRVSAVTSFANERGRVLLATGGSDKNNDDGIVRIWDPVTGAQVGDQLTSHTNRVSAVTSFTSERGRVLLAAGSNYGAVWVWDPITGALVRGWWSAHTHGVEAVTSFTNEQGTVLLATAGGFDRLVCVWDPATGDQVGKWRSGHTDRISAVTSFANERGQVLLATGSFDGTVRIWDPGSGAQVGDELTGHAAGVRAVASFATGGRVLLATAGDDTTLRLWDPVAGSEVARLVTGSPVASLAYGRDPLGPFLVLGGTFGELALVELALEDWRSALEA